MALTKAHNRMIEGSSVNVKDFGAVGDGVTDDTAAFQMVASTFGEIIVPSGEYALNDITIDVPLFFEHGASINAQSGQTVTITNTINSARQFIFKGVGDYDIGHDTDTGEDARNLHVSWFGAFPSIDDSNDVTANIQKALNSVGNTRESVLDFDVGNYKVGSQITVTRGAWIRGSGSRRTVFSQLTDGFITFVTSAVACRFSNIQFENVGMTSSVRTSPYISIQHDDCDIYDVKCGRAFRSIEVQANACRVDNIIYVYDLSAGAVGSGSSVIAVRGNDCRITNILGHASADIGPDYILHLGANIGSLACSNIVVENVNGITPSEAVFVDANNVAVHRINITNVTSNCFTGTAPDAVIRIQSGGSNSVDDIIINGVLSRDYPTNGIVIQQNSSATMQDIMIDNVSFNAMSGNGISFEQTSGSLREVTIGSNVNVGECTTPYNYSGSYSDIRVNATAISNVNPAMCYDYTIGDDAIAQIDLHRSVYTGFIQISVGSSDYIVGVVRAASSPTITTINASANFATATTILSGTTGTDGKFTLGVTDGVLYLENRLGSSQRVSAVLLTGVI